MCCVLRIHALTLEPASQLPMYTSCTLTDFAHLFTHPNYIRGDECTGLLARHRNEAFQDVNNANSHARVEDTRHILSHCRHQSVCWARRINISQNPSYSFRDSSHGLQLIGTAPLCRTLVFWHVK